VQVVGPTTGHGGKFRAPLGNTCLMEFGSSPKPIGQSLIETVSKIPELHDVTVEYAEMGLDALVDSGIADDVPVVKTVRALWRGAAGIREALLLRKLVALLQPESTDDHSSRFRCLIPEADWWVGAVEA